MESLKAEASIRQRALRKSVRQAQSWGDVLIYELLERSNLN